MDPKSRRTEHNSLALSSVSHFQLGRPSLFDLPAQMTFPSQSSVCFKRSSGSSEDPVVSSGQDGNVHLSIITASCLESISQPTGWKRPLWSET